jgi:hypothetical protein
VPSAGFFGRPLTQSPLQRFNSLTVQPFNLRRSLNIFAACG